MIEEMGGDFLQRLRGFYFVAKRRSVTLAGLEMGRNQPTVSHQIKCLEDEFGVVLFDRSRGKMELTSEGEVFLEKAISVFEIIKEIKDEIGEEYLRQKGKIIISASHAIIGYFLPNFIANFRISYPNVEFEIEGAGIKTVLEKVKLAEVDFGIVSLNIFPETVVYHELFETRLKLVAYKNNPFSLEKEPTLEQISEAPFISFPRSSTTMTFIEKTFSERDLNLNVVLFLNNIETIKKYAALGIGVSILDDYTLTLEDKNNLDIFPLDRFFCKRKYGLIVNKRKYLSPPVKSFVHSIRPDIQFK